LIGASASPEAVFYLWKALFSKRFKPFLKTADNSQEKNAMMNN
jgi:hypothetical protein